ncbi:MAG TPA: triple tyrosine motif-containing protein [Verrucomicrobiae bacterium]|nr:triple tyrosine motif-containing protein [Verrucomicrobiae bacterium]
MTCVGTESGLAFIDPAGKLESAADDEINTQDSDRLVWPAANGGVFTARNKFGLFRFSDGALELAATFNDLSGSIDCLWGDATGELLVGTTKEVCVYNQSLPLPWGPPKKTIPVAEAFCIFKQSDGTLWFATDGLGLARMQKGVISWFTSTNGLPSDHVWSVCGDASGTLWVGTEEGLARYRSGRFFAFTREQGLRENIINSLLLEEPDFLWVSGQRGIYRFSLRDLNQVADGAASRVDPFVLSAADGMGTSETNGGKQPASWRGKDGRLWFPTMNGVVSILPRDVPVSEPPPPILIQQVKADDQIIYGDFSTNAPADSNREFTLKPGRGRVVEFTFTANSFLDAKRMRFRYRLVGGQNTWTPETTERTIHYINLRPGDYRFEVIGANEHNTWSPVPAVFQFRIEPHFWQTTAFYILCFCAAAALALGIQAYRLRWQRRLLALEQQKALANERSRIARDLHDDLGTALTGLALELDVAGRDATKGNSVPERLHESAARTRSLAERMRQVVWTVNPKCDNVASLATFLEQQVEQFFRHDGVRLRIDFPDEIPEVYLGSEARYQLALVVREALTNVIRHANAVEVILKIELRDGHGLNGTRSGPSASEDSARLLIVTIKDNGRGFPAGNKGGNGLSNMRDRLSKIGGTCEISSTPGAGTTVSFILPVSYSHETT